MTLVPGAAPDMTGTVVLGEVPKSVNVLGARGDTRQWQREKKRLERDIGMLLLASNIPQNVSFVAARVDLAFKVARGRDIDNFTGPIAKALGDALQARWIRDDTPAYYRFEAGELIVDPGLRTPETRIRLEVWK